MVSCAPVYPQGLSEYEDKENLDGGNCTWMDETFVDGTVSGLQKMLEVKNCAGCQPPVNLPTHFLVHCPLRFHFFCLTLLIVEKLSALYFFCHTLLIVEYLSCEVAVKLHWREGTAGKRNVHHWPLHLCIYCQHSNETNVKIEDRLLLSRGEQSRWCEVS